MNFENKTFKAMNGGINMSLFIQLFNNKCDYEIAALIISWLSNGWEQETYFQNQLLLYDMKPSPTEYVLNYNNSINEETKNKSFFNTLTYSNYNNLIIKIREFIIRYGNIQNAYLKHIKKTRRRIERPHETLALMFGGDTGFQTKMPNCTFYRYNLFIYLVAYKYKIWDVDIQNAIIPCNDEVFKKAYENGIITKKMKSTLDNAIILTDIAKKKYGRDFYEILNDIA